MKMKSMARLDGYIKLHEVFLSRMNYYDVFMETMSKISTDVKLASVKSCLALGPSDGKYEIGFLKHCAANVSKFLAVEPDHEAAELLRTALKSSMPGAESHVIETDIQKWKGLSDPVDLILLFQVLYYVTAEERQELFKKIYDQWLAPGGFVVVVNASHTESREKTHVIFERLGDRSPPWEDIEADFHKAGFTKHYAHEMRFKQDFTNPDEALLRFYQLEAHDRVTLDDVRKTLAEVYPEGRSDNEFSTIAIFTKSN